MFPDSRAFEIPKQSKHFRSYIAESSIKMPEDFKAETRELHFMLESFKEKHKKEGERIVNIVFPKKVIELDDLLRSDKFLLSRVNSIPVDINIPVPSAILLDGLDEPQAKKRKTLGDLDLVQGTRVIVNPTGKVTENGNVKELIDLLMPHIVDLMENANIVKMWISFMIPKVEDGNNFGVSIQEDTLAETRQVEADAATYLDQITRYYMTRGKIIAKVLKYPHIEDIRLTVAELDKKQFISLRLVICELRNHYATLHDIIQKNKEKILKPRSSNTEVMY